MAAKRQAVVLLSGGLDSTTCLYWAKKEGYAPIALSIRYGQRHVRELNAARAVARAAKVQIHEVDLALPWLKGSSLTNARLRLPNIPLKKIGRGGVPSTYVPGRNTIFLSLAVSLADAVGAEVIVIGANALDYSGYPDCRSPFINAFGRVAKEGTKRGSEGKSLKILAPLLRLDKKGVVKLARSVGAPLSLTWSCYAGGKTPCGVCDSCKLRAKGFSEAGLRDPAAPSDGYSQKFSAELL
ncbi:MAG: 7-cyano-7-deazaguanine synthase QueC [Elusimicrobia bacterium]|nr:7-cyano-7-deazaguanine synthase QueC [Elusimicrobiota bacterium]